MHETLTLGFYNLPQCVEHFHLNVFRMIAIPVQFHLKIGVEGVGIGFGFPNAGQNLLFTKFLRDKMAQ